jgi:hypothetical protein
MVRWVVLHALPFIRKSLSFENTQGSLQFGIPGSSSEALEKLCNGLGSNVVVQYPVGPIITFHGRITAREYVDGLGNQAHPMMQMLFTDNDAVFQDDSAPIHTAGTVQSWSEEREDEISACSVASTITRFE